MKYLSILVAALSLLQLNCSNGNREAQTEGAKKFAQSETKGIAKVSVDERGDIYLNKKLTSLDALGEEFARIKKVDGVVWYYRAAQSQPAEASGLAIMKKVVEYQLPVKLCASDDPCRKYFE